MQSSLPSLQNLLLDLWAWCLEEIRVLLLFAAAGLIAVSGLVFDSINIRPPEIAVTTVLIKEIVPSGSVPSLVGRMPTLVMHPEEYWLHFRIKGEKVSARVNKKFFDRVDVGEKIKVRRRKNEGRLLIWKVT